MFTGLIEEVGQITHVVSTPAGSYISVSASAVLENLQLGDSIAIDGACTTVVHLEDLVFSIEASPETLSKTTFKEYQPGHRVNLERPLLPTSRIGGHYVTGHVDGQAEVIQIIEHGNSWVYRFRLLDPTLVPYLVEKGSITVSGISLTVNTVILDTFSVAIIPHTLSHTNLSDRRIGETLNIETDILGKYVHRLLQGTRSDEGLAVALPTPSAKTKIHSGTWFCHDEVAP